MLIGHHTMLCKQVHSATESLTDFHHIQCIEKVAQLIPEPPASQVIQTQTVLKDVGFYDVPLTTYKLLLNTVQKRENWSE